MQHPVKTAVSGDSVTYAAQLMRDGCTGLVPIVDEAGRLSGAVSERDIVLAIANGISTDAKLGKIAGPAVTCGVLDALEVAEKEMSEWGALHVVVCVDAGVPRGVISVSDLARHEDPRRAATVLRLVAEKRVRS